jgi:hypothetical protein
LQYPTLPEVGHYLGFVESIDSLLFDSLWRRVNEICPRAERQDSEETTCGAHRGISRRRGLLAGKDVLSFSFQGPVE